jgi:hypothetical protein
MQRKQGLIALRRPRIEERGLDLDVLAKHCPDRKRIEAALEFASAVDYDLGHVRLRQSGLVVDHPGTRAVARQIQPVDVSMN